MTPTDLLAIATELHTKKPARRGVYMIYCTANKMAYIGSSAGLYARLSSHQAKLNKGTHLTPHLQNAWKCYGKSTFQLKILEFKDDAQTSQELLDRENHYLLMVQRDMLFNVNVPAILGGVPLGTKMSAESCAKMSERRKGKPVPWAGKKRTDEQKKAQSDRCKLIPHEHFVKMANAHRPNGYDYLKGEGNGRAVLTVEDVLAIRAEYDAHMKNGALPNGFFSQTGRRYKVYYGAIVRLCRRKAWTSVPEAT